MHVLARMIYGDISVGRLVWMRPCRFCQHLAGVHGSGRLVSSLFRQCISFCVKWIMDVVQLITFAEEHVKRLVILTDRLGSVILSVLRMKGRVASFARAFKSTRLIIGFKHTSSLKVPNSHFCRV